MPIDPSDAIDMELRFSDEWTGSSATIDYHDDGSFDEAAVLIRTDNPYKLMTLLRWLGIDTEATASATRIPPR